MNTPKLITVEGIDNSGKSSICRKLWFRRNKIDIIQDRGIVSCLVYNDKYKRDIEDENYLSLMNNSKDTVIVHLRLSNLNVLKSRYEKANEDMPITEEVENDIKLFDEKIIYLKKKLDKVKFISIETDNITSEDVLELVLDKINKND